MCLLDAIGFPLGNAFFSTTTVIPVALAAAGADKLSVGLLVAMIMVIQAIPGLIAVRWVSKMPIVKNYVGWVGIGERVALLPLAWFVVAWGPSKPTWFVTAVFGCFALHMFFMGINMPAYWVLVGKVIPTNWRGRLYGFAGGIAGVLSIGVDALMRNVVFSGKNDGFPHGYSAGFVIGFVILMVSLVPLFLVREQPMLSQAGNSYSLAAYKEVWTSDSKFRQLTTGQLVFVLSSMMVPFLVLHGRESLGATDGHLATYTTVTLLSSSLGSLYLGYLSDKYGNFKVYKWSMVVGVVCALYAIVCRSASWYTVVFVLQGLSASGVGIVAMNLVMELAGSAKRIGVYSSFYSALTSIPRAIAPVIGSLIAGGLGYVPLFSTCVVAIVIALWITLAHRHNQPTGLDTLDHVA